MSDPISIQTPDAPAAAGASPLPAIALVAAIAAPVLLAGCGGGGGGDAGPGADTSPTLSITSIEVRGTTNTVGNPVSVNTNVQPAVGGVAFALNGVVGGTQMPADPGRSATSRDYSFAVSQPGASGINLIVTINPSPAMVLPVVGVPTYNKARHLLSRTAFGASWDDLMALLGMDYNTAVDAMVDNTVKPPVQTSPDWINTHILTWQEFQALGSQAAQDAYQESKWRRRHAFKGWLMKECAITPNPFTERLTMFWANHFVVNVDDIEEPQLAWRWWKFLRDNCTGNFKAMVKAMSKMPAMVIYLNGDTNKVGNPNENFGRELMELFTLGEGQVYGEPDVVEVARAFTGYDLIDAQEKAWVNIPGDHDNGNKTILGVTGNADGDAAIDIILDAGKVGGIPRAARFVVEKLWLEFVGTTPPAARVTYFANILYTGGGTGAPWDLKPLLKAFFKSTTATDFTDPANIGIMLKNPIELVCGFHRSFGITISASEWEGRAWRTGEEDQNVLCPPNVKGWLGGTTWINAKSLLARYLHLSWSQWEIDDPVPRLSMALKSGHEDLFLAKKSDRVFPADNPANYPWELGTFNEFFRLLRDLIQDPAYQMK